MSFFSSLYIETALVESVVLHIAINGQMKFYGGISNEATYKVIKELL